MSDKEKRSTASELEAREVAEAAREEEWGSRSFARALFDGTLPLHLIDPFPTDVCKALCYEPDSYFPTLCLCVSVVRTRGEAQASGGRFR